MSTLELNRSIHRTPSTEASTFADQPGVGPNIGMQTPMKLEDFWQTIAARAKNVDASGHHRVLLNSFAARTAMAQPDRDLKRRPRGMAVATRKPEPSSFGVILRKWTRRVGWLVVKAPLGMRSA